MVGNQKYEIIVDNLIFKYPSRWEQIKAAPYHLGWFVGQAMIQTQGMHRAEIQKLFTDKLNAS